MKIQVILDFGSIEEMNQYFKENIDKSQYKLPREIRNKKQWTEFEINFLIDNYGKKTTKWISGALQRKETAIRIMVHSLRKKGYKLSRSKRFKNEKIYTIKED